MLINLRNALMAGKRWKNPYPTDSLAFVWSENSRRAVDANALFTTLATLFNAMGDMSISIATKGLTAASNGDIILYIGDGEESWLCPFRLKTRNTGTAESPVQRPYMICDGNSSFARWNEPMRMIGITIDSAKIVRFLNRSLIWQVSHERSSTITASATQAGFGSTKICAVVVYSKALTEAEMQAVYDVHAQEFGWS